MLEDKKFELKDEELDDVAGGTIPYEIYKAMTTVERATMPTISDNMTERGEKCFMDADYVWTEEEYQKWYDKYVNRI